MEPKIHPATTVSNIKSFIPITLEIESSQYASWSELFKIHCRPFLVYDHLLSSTPTIDVTTPANPPTAVVADKTAPPKPTAQIATPENSWDRLDAIVLQWIYGTISNDLLNTILKSNTSAHEAWTTLEGLFHDNKSARAIHLRHRFSNTRLDGFPNVSAYCQELKVLADQLANVGAPVDNDALVLQLIAGLNESYEGIATILQQQDPLPSFYVARSKLVMVESRKTEQALYASKQAGTALHTTSTKPAPNNQTDTRYDDRTRGRGRSRGRGRGRANSWGRGRGPSGYNSAPYGWPQWPGYSPMPWPNMPWPNQPLQQQPNWPSPPCPYPTTSNRPNNSNPNSSGILGSRPNQSHVAYTPTDIEQALYTMSLNQPDPVGYMDTCASSNMTKEQGLQDPDPYPPVQQQR